MRSLAIIALLALLLMPCIAEPDSVTTGPYTVSFDLGLPNEVYNVTVADPEEEEALSGKVSVKYVINIKNSTGFSRLASIAITDSTNDVIPTTDEMQVIMKSYLMESELENIDVAEREIDGKMGAIASGDLSYNGLEIKMFQASYYLSSDSFVFVTSAYPWDEGTLSLLKTIHIENINETS